MLTNYTTGDDAVVTSLAYDDNFIVVGLFNGKIDVFDSKTCLYTQSLNGHDEGVWALAVVTPSAAWTASAKAPPRFTRQISSSSTRNPQPGPSRKSSFSGIAQENTGTSTSQSYQSFFSSSPRTKTSPANPYRTGDKNGCNSAKGWPGLQRPLILSGGCDRKLKVWDAVEG